MKGEDDVNSPPVQHQEIMLDGLADEALHDPLEVDEENFRLSMKSDNIARKKTKQLDFATKTQKQQKKEKIQTDEIIVRSISLPERKPKLVAKVATGMHDLESIKPGSVDG